MKLIGLLCVAPFVVLLAAFVWTFETMMLLSNRFFDALALARQRLSS